MRVYRLRERAEAEGVYSVSLPAGFAIRRGCREEG